MRKTKSVFKNRIDAVCRILFLAVFFLLPLFPAIYSKTNNRIIPVMGYSVIGFLEDRSDTMLYVFSMLYVFELAFVGVAILFSLCLFLVSDEQKKKYSGFSFVFLILAVLSSVSDLVSSFLLKGNNLYPNFGVYANVVYLVCGAVMYFLFLVLPKKKKA